MFKEPGKRSAESLDGSATDSISTTTPEKIALEKHKIILDYVLSQVNDDRRSYLQIKVFDTSILGLLDSGASHTIVGRKGWEILKSLGLHLDSSESSLCTMANGTRNEIKGSVLVPMKLAGKLKLIKTLVVPDLDHSLILGHDFWIAMQLVPDFSRNEWFFSEAEPEVNAIDFIVSRDELLPEQRDVLQNFVSAKFKLMKSSLGCTHLVKHEIVTDSPPIKQRYYPVSPVVQKHIDEELNNMLNLGVIEKSNSSWSSPILLVKKKEGGYRFCVDFRKLNSVTKKDAYPIPYVSSILDRLKGAKYLSSIDIKSAFWQVPMAENSKEYTAFTVPGRGLYHFNRMPFGLCNAPAVWQRLMDKVIGVDLEPYAFVYLDDVIVISSSFEQHMEILETIFTRLIEAGLTVNVEKCNFCKPELRYLGYVIDKKGLRVDPEKVSAILNIPVPTCVKDVRSFIGMASWYRRFVPHFSSIIAPLCNLLKKSNKWNWTSDCDQSFQTIKEYLVTAPILHMPDFSKRFYVQTDASSFGLGAVLSQQFSDGERVICYLSRSLTKQERQYSTTERECLGVLWALERLRPYLEGTEFTVITDHHSLIWLNNLKDPCGRLCRWAVRLQQYNFEIVHRRGKDNVVPDLLSRSVPVLDSVEIQENAYFNFEPDAVKDKWYLKLRDRIKHEPLAFRRWRVESDKIYKYVRTNMPDFSDTEDNWKLVIPKEYRSSILQKCHCPPTSGHPGIFKTYRKLAARVFWPKMKYDVAKYVKNCEICIAHKVMQDRPAGFMGFRPSVSRPFQMISLDLMGPLPRSTKGYMYILCVCDYFSKFVLTFPLRKASAKLVCQHVENDVFLMFGVPQYIISDNGTQFKSKEFQSLCTKYNSTILFNALYHPQNNPTERVNRVIKTMLSMYVEDNQRKWDVYLSSVACAARTLVHEVTGYTPFFITFGREHIIDGKEFKKINTENEVSFDRSEKQICRENAFSRLFEDVKLKLAKAYEKNSRQYNLRRRPVQYSIGQKVWRKNYALSSKIDYFAAKLAPKYLGPFWVSKKLGYLTYELVDGDGNFKGNWHAKDLRPGP